jgi:hypothetical protein
LDQLVRQLVDTMVKAAETAEGARVFGLRVETNCGNRQATKSKKRGLFTGTRRAERSLPSCLKQRAPRPR